MTRRKPLTFACSMTRLNAVLRWFGVCLSREILLDLSGDARRPLTARRSRWSQSHYITTVVSVDFFVPPWSSSTTGLLRLSMTLSRAPEDTD